MKRALALVFALAACTSPPPAQPIAVARETIVESTPAPAPPEAVVEHTVEAPPPPARVAGLELRVWETEGVPSARSSLSPNQAPNVARSIPALEIAPDDLPSGSRASIAEARGDLEVSLAGRYGLRLVGSDAASLYIDGVRELDGSDASELELDLGWHSCVLALRRRESVALEWRTPGAESFEPVPSSAWSRPNDPMPATVRGAKRIVERVPPSRANPPPNPALGIAEIALDALRSPVSALAWLDASSLLVATRAGDVWRVDRANGDVAARFGGGLLEPRAIAVAGARIFVLQASELTELVDANGDGIAEGQRSACAAWPANGARRWNATGLAVQGDGLAITLQPAEAPGPSVAMRYSFADSTCASIEAAPPCTVELDSNACVAVLSDGGAPAIEKGPYAGQLLRGSADEKRIERVAVDREHGGDQSCCIELSRAGDFDFARAVRGPDGALYAPARTALKSNKAVVERLEIRDGPSFDLLAVRALGGVLELAFTRPLAADVGWERANYSVIAHGIDDAATPARALAVSSAAVAEDRRSVALAVGGLADGVLLHVSIEGPLRSEDGAYLAAHLARCFVRRMPTDLPIAMRERPAPAESNVVDAAAEAGWTSLFDGASTAGWHAASDSVDLHWTAERGVLACEEGGADLVSDERFGDFELAFEWRVERGAASAVLFRVEPARLADARAIWPSFAMIDDERHIDGRDGLRGSGACRDLYAARSSESAPAGIWNRARIAVRDGRVEHELNGVQVASYVLANDDWARRVSLAHAESSVPVEGALVLRASERRIELRALRIRRLAPPR